MNCPFECEFLQESRKHETPAPLTPIDLPNQDIRVSEKFLEENENLVFFVSHHLVHAALRVTGAVDSEVRQALDSLIRTWRTLQSGIYYETLPETRPALDLYRAMQGSLAEFQRHQSEIGYSKTGASTVLQVLVFLQRLELDRANGRPLGRAFLNVLWDYYGVPPQEPSPSALILP